MENTFLKLTNAVYKVVEFFPEQDPLKMRAKDKALAIMDNLTLVHETSGWASFQKEKIKVQIIDDIDMLLGYLWVAKTQKWLNSANYLIITAQYEKIKKEIAPIKSFEPKVGALAVLESAGAIINKQAPVSFTPKTPKPAKPVVLKERQQRIVDYLAKNDKAQVMDLLKILPDITKRTIRRDLDELLEYGKIQRIGEFNSVSYKINK